MVPACFSEGPSKPYLKGSERKKKVPKQKHEFEINNKFSITYNDEFNTPDLFQMIHQAFESMR